MPASPYREGWLAVRTGMAQLPSGWTAMFGAACLGGIGFTMSFFIAGPALEGHLLDAAKIGILGGSAVSDVIGVIVLSPRSGKDANANGQDSCPDA